MFRLLKNILIPIAAAITTAAKAAIATSTITAIPAVLVDLLAIERFARIKKELDNESIHLMDTNK